MNMNYLCSEIAEATAEYYSLMLKSPQGNVGMEYLKCRSINGESIERFNIGYATDKRDGLVKYLFEKGYNREEILESGLAVLDEARNVMDKFVNRIMVPIMNSQWKIQGFVGRAVADGEVPKYINSMDSVRFKLLDSVFGFNLAKESIAKYMIVCDGIMDVISLHQAGFDMAVASFGMESIYGLAYNLTKYVGKVIIAYKNDEAGWKAAFRINEKLYDCDAKVYYLDLGTYRDVDECLRTEGKKTFEERLDRVKPVGKVNGYQDFCIKIGKSQCEGNLNQNDGSIDAKNKSNISARKKNVYIASLVKDIKEMLDKKSMSYSVSEYDLTRINYRRLQRTGIIGGMYGEIIIDDEYNTCVSVAYPNIRVNPKTRRELESLLFRINCNLVFGMWQIINEEIRYIRSAIFPGKKGPIQMLFECLINDVFDVVEQYETAILEVSLGELTEREALGEMRSCYPGNKRYERRFQNELGFYY